MNKVGISEIEFRDGARSAVLNALNEYMQGTFDHVDASGARGDELPLLLDAIDIHVAAMIARINGGNEPCGMGVVVK